MASINDDERTIVSQPTGKSAKSARACPKCGLIVADSTSVCPQDGTQIFETAQYEHALSNKYEFLTVTGSGGMSVVYKARDYETSQIVAIKMLHSLLMNEQSIKRFQQEAKAITSLRHPNIINVHDFGVSEHGQPYMVMDFIEGSTLADVIKEKGGLSLEESLHRFIQLCDALEHAHEMGVLHRDLKPSNIMISNRDGNFEDARIVDFGIAKLLDKESQEQDGHLTQTGELFGSPLYMSPEQCRGTQVDARTDIYSMGCVMYETLTGQAPLKGGSMIETMVLQMSEVPPLLSEVCPDKFFPSQLEQIIAKALSKNPDERYQTMTDLEYALMQVQPTQGKSGVTKVKKEKVVKRAKRSTPLVAAISSAIAVCAAVPLTLILHKSEPSAPASVPKLEVQKTQNLSGSALTNLAARIRKIHKKDMQSQELIDALKDGDIGMVKVDLSESKISDAAATYLQNLAGLQELNLDGSQIHNITLAALQDLVQLRVLSLRQSQVSGKGLAVFASKPKPYLSELNLSYAYGVRDDAIDVIADKFKKLRHLAIEGLAFDSEHFKKLAVLPLESLNANESQINDDGVKSLANMKTLNELHLSGTEFGDQGLQALSKLKNLRHLTTGHSHVTDKSIPILLNFNELSDLELGGTTITNNSLSTITKLTKLHSLDLSLTKINDSNIALLKNLPNLTSLTVYGSGITDQALDIFSQMPQLENLNVGGNSITDSGLVKLEKLKKLRRLVLKDCQKISLEAVRSLHRKNPSLETELFED